MSAFISPGKLTRRLTQHLEPTKCVFGETVQALVVLDIERWAKAAHDHGVPIVDNTFATPVTAQILLSEERDLPTKVHGRSWLTLLAALLLMAATLTELHTPNKFPGLIQLTFLSTTLCMRKYTFGKGGAFITKGNCSKAYA